ncbi:aminotransferase class III-fold pyridoxal phosphate-dependent enzyme, partial [Congregibacter sp.]|uniref:aminotransferase class III-fold pyridoxal phosphate-dependent enzyme n=1 Tax=Congregibacter sp. TaxID=2744308 RepID=UPI003F6B75B5
PANVEGHRRQAMQGLRQTLRATQPKSLEHSKSLDRSVSDVSFTAAYRVPFPFREGLPEEFKQGSIIEESRGVQLRDVDGNWRYDLTGSYGVNVFGYDFYKACMEEAQALAGDMGPVLGAYHPVVKDNVKRIKKISGLDEISFHMSGTEAVMQAVGLARYHTGRSHVVRLCGAYHGWWDGVQPGVGTHRDVGDVYTLADLSEKTLRVLETRKDIACVLINPLQALSPNANAAGDASLFGSKRSAHFDRESYRAWLHRVRDVCSAHGIVLIFDEVFLGFRLSYGGAQEYFDIQADMVTYGKTLGGGYPVGVLCGTHGLMKRYRDDQPANISFARGTFNSHPYVMAAMNSFLRRIEESDCQRLYDTAELLWNERVAFLNERLSAIGAPVEIVNMHSVLTVLYRKPSRYNWMLQFYLRSEGLELSWIGSGRMIMSFNFSNDDFAEVVSRFERACVRMLEDGWWWQSATLTDASIRRQLIFEMLRARFRLPQSKRPNTSIAGDGRLEESA